MQTSWSKLVEKGGTSGRSVGIWPSIRKRNWVFPFAIALLVFLAAFAWASFYLHVPMMRDAANKVETYLIESAEDSAVNCEPNAVQSNVMQ